MPREQVSEGSVEGQNVLTAAKFIEAMGQRDMAENIREWLRDGKIYHEQITGGDGDGRVDGDEITIDNTSIRPATSRGAGRPLDPDKDFAQVANLARILIHEKIHVHQSTLNVAASAVREAFTGGSWAEVDAWDQTIEAMEKWLDSISKIEGALPTGDGSSREALVQWYEEEVAVLDLKVSYIGDYLDRSFMHDDRKEELEKEREELKARADKRRSDIKDMRSK